MVFLKNTYPFIIYCILVTLALSYLQVLGWCIFFFLVPLLHYVDSSKIVTKKEYLLDFFKMSLFTALFAGMATFWVALTYPLDWMGLHNNILAFLIVSLGWIIFILFLALPVSCWIFFVRFYKKRSLLFNSFFGASCWIFLEYVRSWFIAVAFYGNATLFGPHHTYYSLSHAVSNMYVFRDLFPVGGIYLVSFVVVLINYFIYYSIFFKKERKNIYFLLFFVVGIVLGSYFFMKHLRNNDANSREIKSVVINTYIPSPITKESIVEKNTIATSVLKTIHTEKSLIVFPENFNPFLSGEKINYQNNLVVGSSKGVDGYYQMFFRESDLKIGGYKKQLLMPIGEYQLSIINFLISILPNKKIQADYLKSSVQAKNEVGRYLYKYDNINISGSLCSENISPYIFREDVLLGSNLLVNIASHTPFRDSSLLSRQTLSINMARALESGRYFITASNYNKSFIISDEGDLLKVSEGKEKYSWFTYNVQAKNYKTPYVLYGDYIIFITSLFFLLTIAWSKREKNA